MLGKSGLINWADVYGTEAENVGGINSNTTAGDANASDELSNKGISGTNQSFSWIVFVAMLVVIRILEVASRD